MTASALLASRVVWLRGSLALQCRGGVCLLGAPDGVAAALSDRGLLGQVRGVVLPTARTRDVAGLVGLWAALREEVGVSGRPTVLPVIHLLGDERTPTLAAAWGQGWGDALRLELDAVHQGARLKVAGLALDTSPLVVGEVRPPRATARAQGPTPGSGPGVVGVAAVGIRTRLEGGVVAWVPTARPSTAVRRVCHGADLAVVEVGRRPWPGGEVPWRLSVSDAITAAQGARRLVLVGDDGTLLDDDAPSH